jgi:FkbM family methyltransferase
LDFRWRIRRLIRKFGVDVVRYYDSPTVCRMRLLSYHGINLIFDVGGNQGQYVKQMRNMGYTGRIVSFEPLSAEFDQLRRNLKNDSLVQPVNLALGNYDGEGTINCGAHSGFSSMLNNLNTLVEIDRNATYVGKEEVVVRKIDSIIDEYSRPGERLFVKIDTQGYEKFVMEGASNSLNRIVGVQMELALIPLYEGEALLEEMIGFMSERGYVLMLIEPGSVIRTKGQLIEVDGIFFRQKDISGTVYLR